MQIPASLLQPEHVVTGRGTRYQLADALPADCRNFLIVRSRSAHWANDAFGMLSGRGGQVGVLDAVGEPDVNTLRRLLDQYRASDLHGVIAIGGGAAIDLGKAVAALIPQTHDPLHYLEVVGDGQKMEQAPLFFAALPTTSGTGAEATKNAVITVPDHGVKVSLRDDRMIPDLVILDAELVDGLPGPITFMTGLDAITQLMEPYLSTRATPETDRICLQGLRLALLAIYQLTLGDDRAARDAMAQAAYLSGVALANAGLGVVHGLAGIMGGQLGVAHGAICARLLPSAMHVNRSACIQQGHNVDKFDHIAALVRQSWPNATGDLDRDLSNFVVGRGIPKLPARMLDADMMETLVDGALQASSYKTNPAALSRDQIKHVIRGACQS